jgi:hypothetical protein
MKSSIFWDITPRSPLKINRHFEETYRIQLQGNGGWSEDFQIRQTEKICKHETSVKASCQHSFQGGFFLCLFFNLEDGGNMFLRNVGWLSMDNTALYPRRQNSPRFICSIPFTASFAIFVIFNKGTLCVHFRTCVHSTNNNGCLNQTLSFSTTIKRSFSSPEFDRPTCT